MQDTPQTLMPMARLLRCVVCGRGAIHVDVRELLRHDAAAGVVLDGAVGQRAVAAALFRKKSEESAAGMTKYMRGLLFFIYLHTAPRLRSMLPTPLSSPAAADANSRCFMHVA